MRSQDATAGRRFTVPFRHRLAALSLLALALAALLAGCATNPVTGKRELSLVTSGQEEQMGAEGFKAAIAEYGSYDDPAIQQFNNTVGTQLSKVSHLPNATWHFTVIDDDAVNAFAMPGGYIFVTRGIMAHLNSEAQLAGVLGHEIGHVTHRHSAEAITRQQVAGLGLGVASVLSPTLARYGQLAQQGLGLMFLSYSRTAENEADELGVQYSAAANYDARQMPSTYAMLKRIGERSGSTLPAFLSTHPDPGDREARTMELSRAAVAGKTNLIVRQNEYIDRLEGLVYGADPRQGYFEGATFYHPGLRFTMTMPVGWTYQNGHTAVLAAAPQQRAVMQLTLSDGGGLAPAAFVAQLQSSGKIAAARGGSETVGGYPAWVGAIAVPADNGQQRTLAAAWIRRSSTEMFQILGQSAAVDDADFQSVITSARSLRALTDGSRLSPTPSRIHIVRVTNGGTLASILTGLGPQGAEPEDIAILNNMTLEDRLSPGQRVKTVTPSRKR